MLLAINLEYDVYQTLQYRTLFECLNLRQLLYVSQSRTSTNRCKRWVGRVGTLRMRRLNLTSISGLATQNNGFQGDVSNNPLEHTKLPTSVVV